VRAAELERAAPLQVLRLEEDLRARLLVELPRGEDRGAVGDARKALPGSFDVVEGEHWMPAFLTSSLGTGLPPARAIVRRLGAAPKSHSAAKWIRLPGPGRSPSSTLRSPRAPVRPCAGGGSPCRGSASATCPRSGRTSRSSARTSLRAAVPSSGAR